MSKRRPTLSPEPALRGSPVTSAVRTVIASAAILCAHGAAHAQPTDYAALAELFGEPVTTSATGSPQRASEAPATMEIITADDIRRSGARDIPGVLRHVAGVDVRRTTNDHADVAVRGYNQAFSPRLLVLIDGRQVYADYYGFTPWSTLPIELEAIRQIEVVKGPNSALFGFNAVGGVINIVTYGPLEDVDGSASLRAGTQSAAQGSAFSSFRIGQNAGLKISAGLGSSDDFSTALRPVDRGTRRGNRRETLDIDAAQRLNDRVELSFEATYSSADVTNFNVGYTLDFREYDTRSLKGQLTAETGLGQLQATVYRNQIDNDIYRGANETPFLVIDNDVHVAQLQMLSKVANNHTLRLSAEYRDSDVNTTPIGGAEVFYDIIAVSGMWEWAISPSLTLTNAIRHDHLSLGRDGFIPAGYGLTNEDWDRSLAETSFNSGLVWQVDERNTLRLTSSRGVQLPNLIDLGGLLIETPPFGYASGIPTLDPTVVTSLELAWVRRLSRLGTNLEVNLFFGETRGIVADSGDSLPAQGIISIPANVGDSDTYGLEIAVDGHLGEHWRWGVSYTPQVIDDHLDPGYALETTLIDFEHTSPRHVLKGRLGWSRGPWEVDGYLHYQSDADVIQNPSFDVIAGSLTPLPSYVAVDARIGYRIDERMTVAVSGQNLTDSEQRQTAAPAVERRLLGSFTMRF